MALRRTGRLFACLVGGLTLAVLLLAVGVLATLWLLDLVGGWSR